MKAAIYARVSTLNHGQDPQMQLRELKEYCTRRAWEITSEYIDSGISGAKDSRPELNRMMADALKRRFDAVVCWKFDRFARSVSHLLRALETFKSLGIEFCSFSEQMDTTTPTGKMIFTVLGKRIGRPAADPELISELKALVASGQSLRQVGTALGISVATVHKYAAVAAAAQI